MLLQVQVGISLGLPRLAPALHRVRLVAVQALQHHGQAHYDHDGHPAMKAEAMMANMTMMVILP